MHHSHVKSKEMKMKPMTIENLRVHPEVLSLMYARARKARAEAVRNVFARLLQKLTSSVDLRLGKTHWG
jgi:hypothetical protein